MNFVDIKIYNNELKLLDNKQFPVESSSNMHILFALDLDIEFLYNLKICSWPNSPYTLDVVPSWETEFKHYYVADMYIFRGKVFVKLTTFDPLAFVGKE